MSVTGAIVTFVVVWWLVFFMALPFGVSPEAEPEPGHDPGAPAAPHLWLKAGITTLIALVLTYAIAWFIDSGIVEMRGGVPF